MKDGEGVPSRRKACMGGWCRIRDKCPHFHARDTSRPAERLCVPGADGVGQFIPMLWHRPVRSWERAGSA